MSYDNRGNLLSDGGYVYTWDLADRLASVKVDPSTADLTDADRIKLEYTYDHHHRRTSKTVYQWGSSTGGGSGGYVQQSVTKYIYDGWLLVAETNASNELTRSYVWSAVPGPGGVGGLCAIRVHDPDAAGFPVTATYWPISDDNGNITALIDADTEQVVASYQYTPFGLQEDHGHATCTDSVDAQQSATQVPQLPPADRGPQRFTRRCASELNPPISQMRPPPTAISQRCSRRSEMILLGNHTLFA